MNEAEVFILADRALSGVMAKISGRQWDMQVPTGAPLLDRLLGRTGRDPYAPAPAIRAVLLRCYR